MNLLEKQAGLAIETENIKSTVINFIVPIVCIVVSGALFLFVIYPSVKGDPELKRELATQTQLRDVLKDKQDKINRLVDFKSVLEENSALVNRIMPDEGRVPALLDQIDTISRESGLSLTRLSYSLGDTAGVDSTSGAPAYSSVIVSVAADGNFTQMLLFLRNLESAARILNVFNFRYSETTGTSSPGSGILGFTFSVSAPYMKVSSEAVTDEPLSLDLTKPEFTSFVNKIKALRYYEDTSFTTTRTTVPVEEIKLEDITTESTPSAETPPTL